MFSKIVYFLKELLRLIVTGENEDIWLYKRGFSGFSWMAFPKPKDCEYRKDGKCPKECRCFEVQTKKYGYLD